MYHTATQASFGWSFITSALPKWCCFASLPCHAPHTLTHLRYPDGKIFFSMTNLCRLQTCCTPDQPGARGWTSNLQFSPYHLKEKCLMENHSPAWGMEETTYGGDLIHVLMASLDGDICTHHLHNRRHHRRRNRLSLPTPL